jgi:hypothetical protein
MDVSAVTAKSANYYATNDEGGYIWLSTPVNRDAASYYLYAADNVTSAPTQMLTETTTNIERYGWKISVSGSKANKALVVTPYFNANAYGTKYVRRFYWDGSKTTRVEKNTITGMSANSDYTFAHGLDSSSKMQGADAMNASADKTSDLFLLASNKSSNKRYLEWATLAYDGSAWTHRGTKVDDIELIYADSKGTASFVTALDYVEFNGAKYLAYNTVNSTSGLWGSDRAFLVEVGDGAFGEPAPMFGNHVHGAALVSGKTQANTNVLADVQLHASADGNYLYAYVMFAGGEVACYKYTCLAE